MDETSKQNRQGQRRKTKGKGQAKAQEHNKHPYSTAAIILLCSWFLCRVGDIESVLVVFFRRRRTHCNEEANSIADGLPEALLS